MAAARVRSAAGKRRLIGYLETACKEAVRDRDAAFIEGLRDREIGAHHGRFSGRQRDR
jgi:hypothetical protein